MHDAFDDKSKGARAHHRRRVMDLLWQHQSLSQAQIAELAHLSRATVSSLVTELRGRQLVREVDLEKPTSGAPTGRPPRSLALDKSVGGVVGIEFDHGYIRVAVADLDLEAMVDSELRPVNVADDAGGALRTAAAMVDAMLIKGGLPRSRVMGVGISLPAPIHRDPADADNSTVNATTILPAWVGHRPAAELQELLNLPVLIDNDANLSALAEVDSGAAQRCTDVIYIKASTGIGCGLVLNGKLYRGADGTAGELAHVVVAPEGRICYCGSRGCLGTVAGAQSITEILKSSNVGPVFASPAHPRRGGGYDAQLAQVIKDARRGDRACQRVLRDAAEALGIAVAGLCNVLNPERVVIGGMLGTAGDLILPPLSKAVEEYTSALSGEPDHVVAAHWSEGAEVLGALALVRREESPKVSNRLHGLLDDLLRPSKRPPRVPSQRTAVHRRDGSKTARTR